GHVTAHIRIRHEEGIPCRVVGHWPVAFRVQKADGVSFPVFFKYAVPIDVSLSCFHIDFGKDVVGTVKWKRSGPKKLSLVAVERKNASRFSDGDKNIPLLSAGNSRIDPFKRRWIGVDGCPEKDPFVSEIGIPIVSRQMLIIPNEFARFRIEGER